MGCEANRGVNTVTTARPCWCPATSRIVAFTDAAKLADRVSLGTATGESVDWKGGFLPTTNKPTTTPEATSTEATSTDTTSPSSLTSSATKTPSQPTIPSSVGNGMQSSLGTNIKLAIGLGAGLGAALVLILALLAIRRHRKKAKNNSQLDQNPPGPPQPVALYHNGPNTADLHSPAWSGHKSELDAIGTASPSPRYGDFSSTKSEIEGSPAFGGEGRPVKDGGWEMPGKLGTVYEVPG